MASTHVKPSASQAVLDQTNAQTAKSAQTQKSTGTQAPMAEPRDASGLGATSGASYYRSLAISTRGGFTQRLLDSLNIQKSAADILNNANYEQAITRVQAASVVGRVLKFGEILTAQPVVYKDVPLSHWGATSVYRAQEEGIFRGQDANTFNPDGALGNNSSVVLERAIKPGARVKFDRSAALKENDRGLGDPEQIVAVQESRNPQITKGVYQKHKAVLATTQVTNSGASKANADAFKKHWEANKSRYEKVARQVNLPANLIAALHWRESSGNFGTYMHNGEKLGQVTKLVPKGKLFYNWEDSAVDALRDKGSIQKDLNITQNTTDEAALATYAEYYNGLGYHNNNYNNKISPYVYSGTNKYTKGKYVADGKYDKNAVDKQVGVVAMLRSSGGNKPKVDPRSTTLLEGQVHVQGKAIANATVYVTDSAGVTHNLKSNSAGMLQLKGKLNPGLATVSVNGVVSQVNIKAGAATWTSIEVATKNSKLVRTLSKGCEGADVAALQILLNSKGNYGLSVDGSYGNGTKSAVTAYQKKVGLKADGVVGQGTWGKLIS